jgi:hypothetical protein
MIRTSRLGQTEQQAVEAFQRCQQRPSALALQDGAAIGHEPRVTDLDEAEGQDVSEKSLDEALGVKCHGVGAAGTKRHAACIEALQRRLLVWTRWVYWPR